MSDSTKEYIVFLTLVTICVITITAGIVIYQSIKQPDTVDPNYTACLEKLGTFIAHGPGEYECRIDPGEG